MATTIGLVRNFWNAKIQSSPIATIKAFIISGQTVLCLERKKSRETSNSTFQKHRVRLSLFKNHAHCHAHASVRPKPLRKASFSPKPCNKAYWENNACPYRKCISSAYLGGIINRSLENIFLSLAFHFKWTLCNEFRITKCSSWAKYMVDYDYASVSIET